MKKEITELVFILDRSGSMSGLERDTIGGFNSLLEKQKKLDGECRITTVLFNNEYTLLHDRLDLRAVRPMTEKDYCAGGSTALLDAIGKTLGKIGNAQKNSAPEYRAKHVMIVIITDGAENSSREFTKKRVKEMIERQQKKYGWEFVFLGANMDAVTEAGSIGIAPNRAQEYRCDGKGTEINMRCVSDAAASVRSGGSLDDDDYFQGVLQYLGEKK